MAFSDFKSVEQVLQQYPLKFRRESFLPQVTMTLPSQFLEDINFSLETQAVGESESFFRESFIFPFLNKAWQQHRQLKLWINRALVYDTVLFGEPDYLISMWPAGVIDRMVNKPLLAVVEAKKQDFENGWGQCLAAMIACQRLNRELPVTIYGIVTTGLTWQFAKLEQEIFTQDLFSYSIDTPAKVLGLLNYVLGECEQQLLLVPA